MALFKPSMNSQAFLKCGELGFAGAGKTHTAALIAAGLHAHIKSKAPVLFLDTETGYDWVKKSIFEPAKVPSESAKTRAFSDLVPAVKEAEARKGILIIDSITHFWREFCDSYQKKLKRTRLQFQDWSYLKSEWAKFTDEYINSQAHIILCGRAGYEYDFETDEDGKKELIKTGVKMKAETEMGYEPSLLILMERSMNMETKKIERVAQILKDRSGRIDGMAFPNPTFESFRPHIDFLNLGGEHVGVDLTRTSEALIPGRDPEGDRRRRVEIALDEIESILVLHHPGTSKEEKLAKANILKETFDTNSWERIKTFPLEKLRAGFEKIRERLEPIGVEEAADAISPEVSDNTESAEGEIVQ